MVIASNEVSLWGNGEWRSFYLGNNGWVVEKGYRILQIMMTLPNPTLTKTWRDVTSFHF
jgi:hypothetical protein